MSYKTIIVEEKDLIGRITFNSPPLNVLNIEMMKEINKAIKDFQGKKLKVLILTVRRWMQRGLMSWHHCHQEKFF